PLLRPVFADAELLRDLPERLVFEEPERDGVTIFRAETVESFVEQRGDTLPGSFTLGGAKVGLHGLLLVVLAALFEAAGVGGGEAGRGQGPTRENSAPGDYAS